MAMMYNASKVKNLPFETECNVTSKDVNTTHSRTTQAQQIKICHAILLQFHRRFSQIPASCG